MATALSKLYNRSNTAYDINDATARSDLATKITKANIIATLYPVGSIYISVASTNPGTFLSGTTWERISGAVFLMAAGSTYGAGTTGGSATRTLVTANLPSHSHTFTGKASSTGNQSQGHTHSGTTGGISANHSHSGTSGNPSANHTHGGNSHTHTIPGNAGLYGDNSGQTYNRIVSLTRTNGGASTASTTPGNTGYRSADHTHSTTTGNPSANHTHGVTTGGISANHTHKVATAGSIGNTGSGTAFDTMPPYLAVYMWKRTK